jgi:hypothetical protein
MEDLRRRKVSPSGRTQAICTLCEVEGRSNVQADYEYVLVSTMNDAETRVTVCTDHAGQLDNERLPYRVVRQRKIAKKGLDWAHPL